MMALIGMAITNNLENPAQKGFIIIFLTTDWLRNQQSEIQEDQLPY
jgi:hypothetical protein